MVLEPVKTFGRIPAQHRAEAYLSVQAKPGLEGLDDAKIRFMAIMEYNTVILPRENSKNGDL